MRQNILAVALGIFVCLMSVVVVIIFANCASSVTVHNHENYALVQNKSAALVGTVNLSTAELVDKREVLESADQQDTIPDRGTTVDAKCGRVTVVEVDEGVEVDFCGENTVLENSKQAALTSRNSSEHIEVSPASVTPPASDGDPRAKLNRDVVVFETGDFLVVNAELSGEVWVGMPDTNGKYMWRIVKSTQNGWRVEGEESGRNTAQADVQENVCPTAPSLLEFGVREGKRNIIPVLASVRDANQDAVYIYGEIAQSDQSIGAVRVSENGQYLEVDVPVRDKIDDASDSRSHSSTSIVLDEEKGTARRSEIQFSYTDGSTDQNGVCKVSATVVLVEHPYNSPNSAPRQVFDSGFQMHDALAGATFRQNLLASWYDPDGDDVFATLDAGAASLEGSAQAMIDSSGALLFSASEPGVTSINYAVSDGFGASSRDAVEISVKDDAKIAFPNVVVPLEVGVARDVNIFEYSSYPACDCEITVSDTSSGIDTQLLEDRATLRISSSKTGQHSLEYLVKGTANNTRKVEGKGKINVNVADNSRHRFATGRTNTIVVNGASIANGETESTQQVVEISDLFALTEEGTSKVSSVELTSVYETENTPIASVSIKKYNDRSLLLKVEDVQMGASVLKMLSHAKICIQEAQTAETECATFNIIITNEHQRASFVQLKRRIIVSQSELSELRLNKFIAQSLGAKVKLMKLDDAAQNSAGLVYIFKNRVRVLADGSKRSITVNPEVCAQVNKHQEGVCRNVQFELIPSASRSGESLVDTVDTPEGADEGGDAPLLLDKIVSDSDISASAWSFDAKKQLRNVDNPQDYMFRIVGGDASVEASTVKGQLPHKAKALIVYSASTEGNNVFGLIQVPALGSVDQVSRTERKDEVIESSTPTKTEKKSDADKPSCPTPQISVGNFCEDPNKVKQDDEKDDSNATDEKPNEPQRPPVPKLKSGDVQWAPKTNGDVTLYISSESDNIEFYTVNSQECPAKKYGTTTCSIENVPHLESLEVSVQATSTVFIIEKQEQRNVSEVVKFNVTIPKLDSLGALEGTILDDIAIFEYLQPLPRLDGVMYEYYYSGSCGRTPAKQTAGGFLENYKCSKQDVNFSSLYRNSIDATLYVKVLFDPSTAENVYESAPSGALFPEVKQSVELDVSEWSDDDPE
ncbi:MAG: hypothetical protein LBQ41_03910 [Candidatus Ancillula sp.]|nr:hypothetical protein [Candidatus Ancillula sp.]